MDTKNSNTFKCENCGAKFDNEQDLNQHVRECTGASVRQNREGGMTQGAGGRTREG